jgi:O-antigen/teichoic acid export membrane protein
LFYKYGVKFLPRFNKHTFFKLGKIAIPFALAAIFSRIYSRADTIILSKLAGDQAVGWYSIPKKISNAFRFLPMALIASVYPKFSEYYKDNKEKLAYLLERSLKYLMLLVFPISVGIMLLSQDIVITIYTEEYVRSILPLKVLMISLFFSFISFPLGAFLNACDRQKTQTAIVGIVMTVNVILNLILIPKFSVLGAAISALVGNLLLAVLGYYFVPKITDISHKFLISCGAKIGSAAALMGVIVWWINMFVHFLITIVVGAAVYFAVLYLFGIITKELVQEARNLFKS